MVISSGWVTQFIFDHIKAFRGRRAEGKAFANFYGNFGKVNSGQEQSQEHSIGIRRLLCRKRKASQTLRDPEHSVVGLQPPQLNVFICLPTGLG